MSLFRGDVIVALLGLMVCLGIAAVNAQVNTELPQFRSGASVMMGVPVDFNILNQRVGAIYDVVESDDSHIVWKFTGTTGDWAFVFADGRIVVASTVEFDLAAKDMLTKELNDVMDMLNSVFAGIISTEARDNALGLAVYYASEPEIYHRLKYDFDSTFKDFTLVVPNWTMTVARLTITGKDRYTHPKKYNQYYSIDEQEVASCGDTYDPCEVSSVDITENIPVGLHKIDSFNIEDQHSMIFEAITSPLPSKTLVLYGPGYEPWINETGKSMTIDDMNLLIAGKT